MPMSAAQKDWIEKLGAKERLPDGYAIAVTDYLQHLSSDVLELRRELSRPVVIGLNGGQGSGKSTLSLFLIEWLVREHGLSAVCLSLDDLY